jgi:hypothetical protein
MKRTISDNTTPYRRLPDVCLFCSYICMDMCVMLCRKGIVCAQEREETITSYILSQWPQVQGSFFSFSLHSFVTLSLSLLGQMHALFFSSTHTYIHSYIRCVQAGSLSRTKIFLFFFLSHTYILTM